MTWCLWFTWESRYDKYACSEARSLPRLPCMQTSKMVSANERWLADTCSLNKAISSPVGFRTWYVFMTIFPLLYCSIIFIYLQSFRIMNRCVPFTKTTESTLRLQNGPCQPRPYGHRPPSSSYRDVQFASGNCRIYQIRETRTSRS